MAFKAMGSLVERLLFMKNRIGGGGTRGLLGQRDATAVLAYVEDFLPFPLRTHLAAQPSIMDFPEAHAMETSFSQAFAYAFVCSDLSEDVPRQVTLEQRPILGFQSLNLGVLVIPARVAVNVNEPLQVDPERLT